MILQGATVHVGDGTVLENCDVQVLQGKIARVGQGLAREGQQDPQEPVRDLAGKEVFPGFIDGNSFMGTQDMAYEAKDFNENSHPVTPYLDIWHSIDPDEIMRQELYKAGVTSMVVAPANQGLIGGTCAVVKTWGKNLKRMTVRRQVGLKGSVTEEVSKMFGKKGGPATRMAMITLLQEAFHRTDYGSDYRSQRTKEVMDAVREGEIPFVVAAATASEMTAVVEALAADFPNMRLGFALAYQAPKAAEALQKAQAQVILGELTHNSQAVAYQMDYSAFAELDSQGVPVSISLLSEDMMYGRECMLWTASKLMQGRGDSEQVLRMLGANIARFHGVDDRVGLVKPGLDADLLIYEGNPVAQVGAKLLETMIDGEAVYTAPGWEG